MVQLMMLAGFCSRTNRFSAADRVLYWHETALDPYLKLLYLAAPFVKNDQQAFAS